MHPFLIAAVLLQPPLPANDPPRLITELHNKAVVLAEHLPGAQTMTIQLFASSRGVADTPRTHGFRHLLEHLLAKGKTGDLDVRLETQGVFLRAETTRDFTRVSVTGPSDRLNLALEAISEMVPPEKWTQEQVDREARIVGQELALLPDSALFSSALWRAAYGDSGLDPLGDPAVVAGAKADQLIELHKAHFAAPNLVLTVAGPWGVDEATAKARRLLDSLPQTTAGPRASRPQGKSGRVEVANAFGEARAAPVAGFDEPSTAFTVAAGLTIATLQPDAYLTYTPTVQRGLVIVGQTEDNSGMGLRIDQLTESEKAACLETGRAMARRWYLTALEGGGLRGALLVQKRGIRPESFLENIEQMTAKDFLDGFAAFSKDRAVVGVGVVR